MTELALAVAFAQLLLKYGVPATLQIMRDWQVTNPTLEDIEELKKRVPRPETYFEEGV